MQFDRASDQTLLVSLGEEISLRTHHRVMRLLNALTSQPIRAVTNLHPAYCSLLIKFDPCSTTHEEIEDRLRGRMEHLDDIPLPTAQQVDIPVCYGGEFGPDLAGVSEMHGLSPEDVIRIHSEATYHAYFLGFVPGFAYLGGLSPALATPRLPAPRKRVPVGSVGIAGNQTGVYSFPTPGGWRLIGKTPLRLFLPEREHMSLIMLGDEVRFRPISLEEYRQIEASSL